MPSDKLDLGGKRHLGAIPQRRQHRAGLAVVIVDGLLADDDQEGLLFLDELEQCTRGHQRLDDSVGLDVQSTVRTHRQRRTQLLLAVRGPDRRDDDFFGTTSFLDPKRFLERNLVKRVDAHLHPVRDYTGAVRLHADAHVVVHNALDADQNSLHSGLSGI